MLPDTLWTLSQPCSHPLLRVGAPPVAALLFPGPACGCPALLSPSRALIFTPRLLFCSFFLSPSRLIALLGLQLCAGVHSMSSSSSVAACGSVRPAHVHLLRSFPAVLAWLSLLVVSSQGSWAPLILSSHGEPSCPTALGSVCGVGPGPSPSWAGIPAAQALVCG